MMHVTRLFFICVLSVGLAACGARSLTFKLSDDLTGTLRVTLYVDNEHAVLPKSLDEAKAHFSKPIAKASECGAKTRVFYDSQERNWALVVDAAFGSEDDLNIMSRCFVLDEESSLQNITLRKKTNIIENQFTLEFDANPESGNTRVKLATFDASKMRSDVNAGKIAYASLLPKKMEIWMPGKVVSIDTISNSSPFHSLYSRIDSNGAASIYIAMDPTKLESYITKYNCASKEVTCKDVLLKGTIRVRIDSKKSRLPI
jgi:hypothetical protein